MAELRLPLGQYTSGDYIMAAVDGDIPRPAVWLRVKAEDERANVTLLADEARLLAAMLVAVADESER